MRLFPVLTDVVWSPWDMATGILSELWPVILLLVVLVAATVIIIRKRRK